MDKDRNFTSKWNPRRVSKWFTQPKIDPVWTIQRCSEIDTWSHEQTNVAPRSTYDLCWIDHNALGIDTQSQPNLMLWYHLLRLLEGLTRQLPRSELQRVSQINITWTKQPREKARIKNLTRFDNLPTSSGKKEKDLIKPIELEWLQIDPKIQIEKLHTRP